MKNVITYVIKNYWELYRKRYFKFPRSFIVKKSKSKTLQTLKKREYVSIVSTYMDVYFNELYYQDEPKYFFLGGLIEKLQGAKSVFKKRIIHPILLFWYQRPNILFFTDVKISKQNGTTNRIYKLDKKYKEERDIDILKNKTFIDEIIKNDLMFKNAI